MSEKINIAVVGGGVHAQIAHIPVFTKHPQCNVVALCDPDVRKLDHLSQKYNIPVRCQDYQEILDTPEIDAVIIATPNYLHAPMAIAAMKYGKHVLCESPMAVTHQETLEMVDAARASGKKLALAMNNRLRPDVQTLHAFIRGAELGQIYYIKSGWLIGSREWKLSPWRLEQLKSGGGVFLGYGTTVLDIALFLLKNKRPSQIFASTHRKEPEAQVEDTGLCIINFTDDTVLTVEVSWSLLFEEDFLYCNAFGRKGAALLNPLRIQKELHNDLFNVTPTIVNKNVYKASYEQQAIHFVEYLTKDRTPPITSDDGVMIARIADAFYESAEKKQLVKIE
ncbi:MAG: Gfo/Idh/MocA family oxidoreductase [candidate division WOR-3 bacterium]|nr:MAG: Gfo/Idh/MocA family oxidoreductase [candidate division WOR-3 bacterium]